MKPACTDCLRPTCPLLAKRTVAATKDCERFRLARSLSPPTATDAEIERKARLLAAMDKFEAKNKR